MTAEHDALVEQNERLRHLLLKLQRRQFGRKSERLTDEQLQFAFEEIEATLAENAAEAGKRSPAAREQQTQRRRAGRGGRPAHLPEIKQVLAPEATTCPCRQGPLGEIGSDTARRLDVIPAQFRTLVTRRPKLACRACPGVVLQAPAPARLVEGGSRPRRPSRTSWYRATPITCRCTGRRRSWRARGSGSAARSSPTGSHGNPRDRAGGAAPARDPADLAAPVRRRDHHAGTRPGPRPDEEGLRLGDRARRPALGRHRSAGRGVPLRGRPATETLRRIAALYAIEAEIRGQPPETRQAVRQARSRPLVEALFAWLEAQLARLPGGSPTAKAIRYPLNHRKGLCRFLDDGRIELDTNTVERAIRPVCLSRKNALFASGDDGGARWCAAASLVETCKLNGVDPQRYFTDLLTRLVNGWPNDRIDELMPWCWADPQEPTASAESTKGL